MNLKNSQLEEDNWIKGHSVRYFNEPTNRTQLTEKVGELSQITAPCYGEQSEQENESCTETEKQN